MFELRIENPEGESIILTGRETDYQVIKILGLNPPKGAINTTLLAGVDGARFNSSRLETRNIVITVKIHGDTETNRQRLYTYLRTKENCKIYYTSDNRNVWAEGYIDSFECNLFSNSEEAQISIICPDPYFKDVDEIVSDISATINNFTFPFSINLNDPIAFSTFDATRTANVYNEGSSGGMEISINFEDDVSEIEIRNTVTNEHLTLDYSFLDGDSVVINTNSGKKSIMLTRNGVVSNIFTALQSGSTFLQLRTGDNFFSYLADSGTKNESVYVTFIHSTRYRGV